MFFAEDEGLGGLHRSDDRVFEFDSGALSVSGGRYDWSIELPEPDPGD